MFVTVRWPAVSQVSDFDAIAFQADQIHSPGEQLEAVEALIAQIPNPPAKRRASESGLALPSGFEHAALRNALVRLVERLRGAWETGDDFGLVGTIVGRLEFFEGFDRDHITWYS